MKRPGLAVTPGLVSPALASVAAMVITGNACEAANLKSSV